jgi:hypothetical protein
VVCSLHALFSIHRQAACPQEGSLSFDVIRSLGDLSFLSLPPFRSLHLAAADLTTASNMVSVSFIPRSCALVFFYFASSALGQTTCKLAVPPNPLTAAGLATPYQVTGCNQIDFANQGSFVEAAIFDPATNAISIYHPLVVNAGSKAGVNFIAPVPATVPAGATVGIWFGTNAMTLQLTGTGAGACVNGLGNSLFGQFAHCNGDVFMKTAQAAIANGGLVVPPIGTATAGNNVGMCPSTRDFRVVDMDQSDNVDSKSQTIEHAAQI